MSVSHDYVSQLLLPNSAVNDVNSSVRTNTLCRMCLKIPTQSENLKQIAETVLEKNEDDRSKPDKSHLRRNECSKECTNTELRCELFNHYESGSELAKSALAGCHLCTLFCLDKETRGRYYLGADTVKRNATAHVKVYLPLENSRGGSCDLDQAGYFTLLILDVAAKRAELSLVFTSAKECAAEFAEQRLRYRSSLDICTPALLPRMTGHSASANPTASVRSISPASEATSELTLQWLRDCVNNHSDCGVETLHTGFRPTRVLDIGLDREEALIRLCNPRAQNLELSYVTLSHCWGGVATYTLNSTTLQELSEGVPLSKFPSTFQDAIQICRKLQQRYLWIDSLCIQQDDLNDWKKESALMGSVYGASLCTIAAVDGENSRAGCYTRRNPLINRPCWLSEGPALVVYIDEQKLHDKNSHKGLFSRGWVLQERLLSRRTLEFSKSGVSWDCRQRVANEEHVVQIPEEAFDQDTVNLKKTMTAFESSGRLLRSNPHNLVQFTMLWYDVVRSYSKLDLTFASDRPVAFSGIATAVEKWSGLTYYYGLWREYILQDLMWYTPCPTHYQEKKSEIQRPAGGEFSYQHGRRSPSFSWLSSDVRIDYHASYLQHPHDQSRNPSIGYVVGMHTMCLPHYVDNKHYVEEFDLDVLEREGRSDFLTLVKRKFITMEIGSSSPSRTELKYSTRVLHVHQPQEEQHPRPWIHLCGPVLEFRATKLGHVLGRSRWSHPYYTEQDILGKEDQTPIAAPANCSTEKFHAENSTGSCRMIEVDPASGAYWFFPDDGFFEWLPEGCWMDIVCITIARWVRQPQNVFYAGGLVLTSTGEVAEGSKDDRTNVYERIGYFEHFWRSKPLNWDNFGDIKKVLLT